MANEIAGFGSLNFIYLVNILSELIVRCVIGFGKFARISKDQC